MYFPSTQNGAVLTLSNSWEGVSTPGMLVAHCSINSVRESGESWSSSRPPRPASRSRRIWCARRRAILSRSSRRWASLALGGAAACQAETRESMGRRFGIPTFVLETRDGTASIILRLCYYCYCHDCYHHYHYHYPLPHYYHYYCNTASTTARGGIAEKQKNIGKKNYPRVVEKLDRP